MLEIPVRLTEAELVVDTVPACDVLKTPVMPPAGFGVIVPTPPVPDTPVTLALTAEEPPHAEKPEGIV